MEEQAQELEALLSIFYESEIEVLSRDPIQFHVNIYLDSDTITSLPIDKLDTVGTFTIDIKFTEAYPDTAPLYEILGQEGLSEEEIDELQTVIDTAIQDNLGTQMVFTIVSYCKEKLESLVRTRREEKARIIEQRQRAEEEAEQKRSQGTKVTAESFAKWNDVFLKEVRHTQQEFQRIERKDRLTGRQMFEKDKTLAKSDVAMLGDGDVAVDVAVYANDEKTIELEEEVNDVLAGFGEDDD